MRRVGWVLFWLVQALFLVWVLLVITTEPNCDGLNYQQCQTEQYTPKAIGVALIAFLWLMQLAAIAAGVWVVRLFRDTR